MTAARVSAPASLAPAARVDTVRAGTGGVGGEPGNPGAKARPEHRWQEDRWHTMVAPVGRFSGAMGLVLLLSVVVHVLIVGSALVPSPADAVAPQQETPVEIVREVPKAAPEEQAPKREAAKEAPKPAAAPPPDLRKDASEPPDAKPPVERQAARPPEPPRATASKASEPKADEAREKLAALREELEDLKAQRQALEAARAESAASPLAGAGQAADTGLGPLPDSFRAVALPVSADGAGEAVSYQQVVFSQLAKAKGIGGREGQPGSAGVRFAVDEAGRLTSVAVVAPSGIPSLDAEALAIVRRAAPFPPPPPGAQRVFAANVNFTPAAALPPRR